MKDLEIVHKSFFHSDVVGWYAMVQFLWGEEERFLALQIPKMVTGGWELCKWIPVAERLPEKDKMVLVMDRITGEITTAYLNDFDSFVFNDGRGHGASHWMPLPEPPKDL